MIKVAVAVVVVALAGLAFGVGMWGGQQTGEASGAAALKIAEDAARARQATAQEERRKSAEEHARLQESLDYLKKTVASAAAVADAEAKAKAAAEAAAAVVDAGASDVADVADVADAGPTP